MKKAGNYAVDFGIMKESTPTAMGLNLYRDTHIKSQQDIIRAIKQAQQDAIEATLALAAENVKLDRDGELHGDEYFIEKYNTHYVDTVIDVNKNSILSLKDELFKQVWRINED